LVQVLLHAERLRDHDDARQILIEFGQRRMRVGIPQKLRNLVERTKVGPPEKLRHFEEVGVLDVQYRTGHSFSRLPVERNRRQRLRSQRVYDPAWKPIAGSSPSTPARNMQP